LIKRIILTILMIICIPVSVCALSAQSAILLDASSGRVLKEHNSYERLGMASTTKIMTAIVAIENASLDEIVTVSKNAGSTEGSSIWLSAGEKIKLNDLLYGLMLNSGNDSAVAIAEHISESVEKFVELMNNKVKELGLKSTNFTNPHGLSDDNHYTTAYDLAQITRYAMNNPKFCEIVSTVSKRIPWEDKAWDRSLVNHNKMLKLYDGVNGVKTGFTKATGRCLVTSAERDGLKLIAVTLNAPDDWNDHTELLNYGFDNYKNKKITANGDYMKTVLIKGGVKQTFGLYSKTDFSIAVSDKDTLETEYKIPKIIKAPIFAGKEYGYLDVKINGKKISSILLVSKLDIKQKFWYYIINKFIKDKWYGTD